MLFEDQAVYPTAELFIIRQFMKSEGISPSQWLLGTGLEESDLYKMDLLVSLRQFDMIYRNLYRLCTRVDLGLALGRALNLSRWGILGMAQMCSKTLGDALETGNHYQGLLRSRFHLDPIMTGGRCEIEISKRESMDYPINAEYAYEVLLGTITSQMQDISGQEVYFEEIQLNYSAPPYHHLYEKYLGCKVQFDCERSMAAVSDKFMTRPLTMSNRVAKQQALALYEQELRRIALVQQEDFRWQVRDALTKHGEGTLKLDQVADILQVTPRTLRRKLQKVGTSFREISQSYQLEQALTYLAEPGTKVSTVANRCGFSDLASFREAFKKHTGLTPQAYRKGVACA
ncbi:MAG: AraC family transcriptional regulator [Pseudomonadales bacterium]|nr:AraC family transcriptional regulator [Pseudomonadales bacterium]